MFDIGFLELIIVSIVGLLVLGPERLPGAIRTVMAYVNKIRRSFAGIRAEIERELQADEFRQDLHNQGIMEELKQVEKTVRKELGTGSGVKLGKDGYPIDQPYQTPDTTPRRELPKEEEPSAEKEPSAGEGPSADKEPSAEQEPSAKEEPSAEQEPSARKEPSVEPEPQAATDPATEQESAAAQAKASPEPATTDPADGEPPAVEPPTAAEPDADKPAAQP